MAGLYLYAIAGRPLRRSGRGMFGRPLRSLRFGDLYAIVEAADRPPRPTVGRLRAHNRVLRALSHEPTPLLPARFGAFGRTRRDLGSALQSRRAELARALRRVRGCVQMTVRLFPGGEPAAGRPAGGTDYLRQVAAREKKRVAHPDVRRVSRAVRRYTKAERIEWHDGPRATASIYHLVPRAKWQAYLAAVSRLERPGGPRFTLSGPFLPFAFVEDLT